MALDVGPDSLRQAAAALALLPQEINKAPQLKSDAVVNALKGSAIAGVLAGVDAASSLAKAVIESRFNEFAGLLALSADKYKDSDADTAQRLAAVTDLYQGTDANNPTAAPATYETNK